MNRLLRIGAAVAALGGALAAPAGAAFEDIGAGARPTGMGSVFTAIADDANTLYYNPAGLGQLRHPQFTGSYGRLFVGLSDGSNLGSGFAGVTVPLKDGRWGTFGVGVLNLSLLGAYRENIYALSYGREILPSLYAGASIKQLHKGYVSDAYTAVDPLFQQHGLSASAFSADLGLLYRLTPHYVGAFTIKDVNQPDVGLGMADVVPAEYRAGFAYYERAFVVSGEVSRKSPDTGAAIGAEHWFYGHSVAARGGFEVGTRSLRNLSLGASARLGNAQVDYSFNFPLSGIVGTAGSHRFALTIRFGKLAAGPIVLLEQDEIMAEPVIADDKLAELRKQVAQCGVDRCQQIEKNSQAEEDVLAAKIAGMEAELQKLKTVQPSTPTLSLPAASPDDVENALTREKAALATLRKKKAESDFSGSCHGFKRPGIYTVREGDTLQSIAACALGDVEKWPEIYRTNRDRMKRAGVVTPGDLLIIP